MNKKNAYWVLMSALLCSGWCMIWIYRTMLTAVYAELQQSVGQQSSASLGMISSSYFIGYVIMQIPGGILMDRLGKKRVLIPCLLLFAAASLITGTAGDIAILYVGSAMAGVATGTYYSGAFSLSAQYVPENRRFFANSVINTGCAAGMIIGYSASSIIARNLGGSWRIMPFVVLGGCALLALAFALFLKNDAPAEKSGDCATRKKGKAASQLRELASPAMLLSYFFYFGTCYGYYMIATWLPSFLQEERGFEGSLAGMAASIVALASIPAALILSKYIDKKSSRKRLYLVGLQLLSAAMLVLVVLLRSRAMLIASIALYGAFGKQAVDPLIVPCVNEHISDDSRSTGLGVFNCLSMSASIFAPYITGAISDSTGSQRSGFILAAALLAASAILFAFGSGNMINQERKL